MKTRELSQTFSIPWHFVVWLPSNLAVTSCVHLPVVWGLEEFKASEGT